MACLLPCLYLPQSRSDNGRFNNFQLLDLQENRKNIIIYIYVCVCVCACVDTCFNVLYIILF